MISYALVTPRGNAPFYFVCVYGSCSDRAAVVQLAPDGEFYGTAYCVDHAPHEAAEFLAGRVVTATADRIITEAGLS